MRLRILLLLVCLLSPASASEDVPTWALVGILMKETRSYYVAGKARSKIEYVDTRDGLDGEVGPFQMTPVAFKQISKPGESFARMRTDMLYAEEKAKDYLRWLHKNAAKGDWHIAVAMYNVGPTGYNRQISRAIAYLRSVRKLGGG